MRKNDSEVAQLVERWSVIPYVGGSNPPLGAKIIDGLKYMQRKEFLKKRSEVEAAVRSKLEENNLRTHACHSSIEIKLFEGKSLLDIALAGDDYTQYIDELIGEERTMQDAYDRSGLRQSKATPNDNWKSYMSIPGGVE